jgi:hypothetical protein
MLEQQIRVNTVGFAHFVGLKLRGREWRSWQIINAQIEYEPSCASETGQIIVLPKIFFENSQECQFVFN